ncbi:ABC transporter ATP-binding protein/permease [Frankia sp. Ag45/Mut15]|uniref:ABC transporter ATP-binding protein/permease n=1 Tax=Frankia umida TaxID=573489 RepID=A0ABT0JRU8_9ACTN|nr:ABC transporter ATP-binding protein [Frankia umida]MCK9874256.1 ABC transporter ATP-binding protein/permease [Frankia umida]
MIRRLFALLGPEHRGELRRLLGWLVAAAALQGVAFVLLVPILRALLGDDPDSVWPWVIALAGVTLGYGVAHQIGLLASANAGAGLSRTVHHRIGTKVAALPLGWFSADRTAAVNQLATRDVMDVMGVFAHLLRPLLTGFVTPAVVVALMYAFDWRLALAATLTIPVLAVVYRWASRLSRAADVASDEAQVSAGARILEFARAQRVLRVFGRGPAGSAARMLDDALVRQREAGYRQLSRAVPGLIGFAVAVQAAFTVLIVVGTDLALGGSLDAPTLLALLVLAARFVEPLTEAAVLGTEVQKADRAVARIEHLLAVPQLPEPAAPRHPTSTTIEFDSVVFSYPPALVHPPAPVEGSPADVEAGRRVLSGVSARLPAGTTTALVGPSGAGKTTVTRLIARFFDVDSGAVRIGGVDVRQIATDELMSLVSVVFQHVYLFEGTIEDNIRVGRPDATDADVRAAARLARVEEIADRLPDGWNTRVGEGGSTLSGGERQRVSIARAILKNAPIVLLDEATSALDPENEQAVTEALSALRAGRTVLVIAHRLGTVTQADQILVLDQGVIAEAGTHAQLIGAGGRYAAFWKRRRAAAGWRIAPVGVTPDPTATLARLPRASTP